MSKRPWTPGPWELSLSKLTYILSARDNALLISKAPEMAEILIDLVKATMQGIEGDDWTDFANCQLEAEELLKSVGWEGE